MKPLYKFLDDSHKRLKPEYHKWHGQELAAATLALISIT